MQLWRQKTFHRLRKRRVARFDCFNPVSIPMIGPRLPRRGSPQWTRVFPNRNFELRKGRRFPDLYGGAWNMEHPTASRDDIIDLLARWSARRSIGSASRWSNAR